MGKETNIAWCNHTFSPVWGCSKKSLGCEFCYALDWDKRFGGDHWGPGKPRREFGDKHWNEPLKWNRDATSRERVFCGSMCDVFDAEWPPGVRDRLWALIRQTPNLDWLLLTKRPENIQGMLPADWGDGYPNVWLGTTVENQDQEKRIQELLKIRATVRFLSCEPLLGPIEIYDYLRTDLDPNINRIHQVIVGGESGAHARPMHPKWAKSLRDQCQKAGVAFFFKQWGNWVPRSACYHTREDGTSFSDADPSATQWPCIRLTESGHDGHDLAHVDGGDDAYMQRVGKQLAGSLLYGKLWEEYPA